MLDSLYIENIAVIEKTTIDFTRGFNVLTGETGAGKSIIIDAIHTLLGQRTSKEIVRTGCSSAFVCGSFSRLHPQVLAQLYDMGYELEENDDLILQRKININGKNTCKVNGMPASLSLLRQIAEGLINIHGQHDSYQLMAPEKHVLYLDSMGNLQEELTAYRKKFHLLKECKHQLEATVTDDTERERKIDLLKYQIAELEDGNITENEVQELTEKKNIYTNKEKINAAFEQAYTELHGEENHQGSLERIESAANALSQAAAYMTEATALSERMNSVFYELQDCAMELSSFVEDLDSDPAELEEIESRLDFLYRLSRKYGATTEEMLLFLDKSKEELQSLIQFEDNLEKLQIEFDRLYKECKTLALALSENRQKVGEQFIKKVKEELLFLNMPNVNLAIAQKNGPLSENGLDKIEFLISTNPGEPPKPVAKIASGGELSRMMLAIKNVLSDNDIAGTLIFDEVDTGISGGAAQKVGLKLKSLSTNKQVICITHQAQIAALADSHFLIKKTVDNERTFTKVSALNFEQRKQELARIIGGVSITPLTLKHAEEMLLAKEEIIE